MNKRKLYRKLNGGYKPKSITKLSQSELERRLNICRQSHACKGDPESMVALKHAAYKAELRRRGLPIPGNNALMGTYGSKTRG